jgi:hypothetical protein
MKQWKTEIMRDNRRAFIEMEMEMETSTKRYQSQ